MTICNNYIEFKEAEEKYAKYLEMVEEKQMPYVSRFDFLFDEEYEKNYDKSLYNYLYEYNMTTEDSLNEFLEKEKKNSSNLSGIIDKIMINLGGEYKYGTLIGLQVTEEDLYYIFKDEKGRMNYTTCVDNLDELRIS